MKAIKVLYDWQYKEPFCGGNDDVPTMLAQTPTNTLRAPQVIRADHTGPLLKTYEIQVKVKAVLLGASDLSAIRVNDDGYVSFTSALKNPRIPGRFFTGAISQVGEMVRKYAPELTPNSPVTAKGRMHCGFCKNCSTGRPDLCAYTTVRGFSVDGALSEYVNIDMRHAIPLSYLKRSFRSEVFIRGLFVEPLAYALAHRSTLPGCLARTETSTAFIPHELYKSALNKLAQKELGTGTIECDKVTFEDAETELAKYAQAGAKALIVTLDSASTSAPQPQQGATMQDMMEYYRGLYPPPNPPEPPSPPVE